MISTLLLIKDHSDFGLPFIVAKPIPLDETNCGDLKIWQIRRRVKQVPLAFYKVIPTSLFEDSDFPGWTFTIPQEEGTC